MFINILTIMNPIVISLYGWQSLRTTFPSHSTLMRDKLHILGISFWFQTSIIKLRDFLLNSGRMLFSKVQFQYHSSRSRPHLSYSIRTYVDVDLILVLPIVSHFLITFLCFSFFIDLQILFYITSNNEMQNWNVGIPVTILFQMFVIHIESSSRA